MHTSTQIYSVITQFKGYVYICSWLKRKDYSPAFNVASLKNKTIMTSCLAFGSHEPS